MKEGIFKIYFLHCWVLNIFSAWSIEVFNKYLLNDYQRNRVNAVNFNSQAIFVAMVAG